MGKRYKKHNRSRKRSKNNNREIFFKREKELNIQINKFMDYYYHLFDRDSFKCYELMNDLRLDIKHRFDIQSKDLHRVSHKRRYVYYDQLAKFKFVYTSWKHSTYCIYIINRYDIPHHLLPFLKYLDSGFMKKYYKKNKGV